MLKPFAVLQAHLNVLGYTVVSMPFLTFIRFHKFPYMLHIRPPDDRGIKKAFSVVWWEGMEVGVTLQVMHEGGLRSCLDSDYLAICL